MGPCLAMLMTVNSGHELACWVLVGAGEKHKPKGAKAVCPTVRLAWQCSEDVELDK